MAWIRRYKPKTLISKISVDSSFMFSSYAWLCVFHCSPRLLCWIKSPERDFLWKFLSFHTEMTSALFLWGSVLLIGELRKYEKNSNFDNSESTLYSTSGSMPLISSKFIIQFLIPYMFQSLLLRILTDINFYRKNILP